jgi:16S rRNA (cytosine967-C5)-methyltransferase
MPVSPARAAAFDILLRVERESSYASELLHSSAHERLSQQDHALATELVMGTLRWRSRLDDEITTAASQPLAKLDLEILIALRLAVYQFHHLDRIPRRAALHESVELVKRARKRSAASFVNAILRKLAAKSEIIVNDEPVSSVSLAKAHAHPLWLVERWAGNYGLAAAQQICQHNQSVPTTAIRLRTPDQIAVEKVTLVPGALLASARRVQAGDITKTTAYLASQVVIQDEASQLVAAFLGSMPPSAPFRILDCCAAPGGKTLAIADHNPNATITALELHPHRARLLAKLLRSPTPSATTHTPNIQIIAADARRSPTAILFDRILADVPCSGTGTLARNPEIKWRLTPDDLPRLQILQRAILHSVLAQLTPRGRLIYSTCSLEKEENEDVIENALAQEKSLRLLDCGIVLDQLRATGDLTWSGPALTRGPYLRTLPGLHPSDGFFAAILERV